MFDCEANRPRRGEANHIGVTIFSQALTFLREVSILAAMSKAKIQTVIENAISKADSSYFFENYTKQAQAVIAALNSAGFAIIAKDLPDDIWKKISDEMRTGRVKPEEHVKDVFQVALRHASGK